MGKMFNALVLSGLASIILFLFDGINPDGVIGKFFMAPQTGWGTFILDAFTSTLGIATAAGAAAIVVGALLIRLDWVVRAGMFVILVSWVEAPLIAMWQFLGGKIVPTDTSCIGTYCESIVSGASQTGMIISGFIMGPVILYALWACFNYIWQPESSG